MDEWLRIFIDIHVVSLQRRFLGDSELASRFPKLREAAWSLLVESLAWNTHRTYSSHWRQWCDWCRDFGNTSVFSAPESKLILYVGWRGKLRRGHGLAWSTVRTGLYAVQSYLRDISIDINIKSMRLLKKVVKGLRKLKAGTSVVRKPLTVKLGKIVYAPLGSTLDDMCLNAAYKTATLGLLRTSEFAVESKSKPCIIRMLYVGSIQWFPNARNPRYIKIRLRYTKTDLWRTDMYIVIGLSGDPEFCAIRSLRRYLYRRFKNEDWNPDEPLFLYKGGPLTKRESSTRLKELTVAAGLNPKEYTNYSFRKGGATSLGSRVPVALLQAAGRWTSDSYKYYLDFSDLVLAGLAKKMCLK